MHYILKGKLAVPEPNPLVWAKWFEQADRHVAQDYLGGERVSTVFLGIDHNWEETSPVLYETMRFAEGETQLVARYSTWEQAELGHRLIVESLQQQLNSYEILQP